MSLSELREEPEEQRECDAEDKASDDGEVERGVFSAVDDIAREATKPEGEFSPEIEKRANDDQQAAEEEQRAAEFAKRVHAGILPEPTEMPFPP